jgi:site-specific recombinase
MPPHTADPRDLTRLLDALDPGADLVTRHLWLIRLFAWVRGEHPSVAGALARLNLLLDAVAARPGMALRVHALWRRLLESVDATVLLADFGFASRSAFLSELGERVKQKLVPATPQTTDASELFLLVLPSRFDAQWMSALDEPLLQRLLALLQGDPAPPDLTALPCATPWQSTLLDALTYCTSQVRATGFAPELRLRMSASARETEAFHGLSADVDAVRAAFLRFVTASHQGEATDLFTDALAELDAALQQFRLRLEACRHAAATVYVHLDEHGISVGLVFRLRQLRERLLRIRALMDCLVSSNTQQSTARLMTHLVNVGQDRRSVRALFAANASLLAAKVAERNSETGENYITRTRIEYHRMLGKAAGGGAVTAITTALKFGVSALGLTAFWAGLLLGLMYAASFTLIQLLHFTLATKQPAMTAPAMAAKLKDIQMPGALAEFVDEVTHLVRSQVAAVLGNVGVVFPAVLLLSATIQWMSGDPMISTKDATYVLGSLTLWGPTVLFAVFTGVLLFASSLIAGWVENTFVLLRLHSALQYNPRITASLGVARAARWAHFMRDNICAFAASISLGLMLGLVPAFMDFFGLGVQVRHVTLSAGQLAAACAALGWGVVHEASFWACLAAIPVIGALNLTVSFYLAFLLALKAHNITGVDRVRIRRVIWLRWRTAPWSFFWPSTRMSEGVPGGRV